MGEKLGVKLGNPTKKEESGMAFHPWVSYFAEGKAFHWLGSMLVRGLLDGEHIFELEPINDHSTRFILGEDYKGLLVALFGRFVEDDGNPNYIVMNEALKKRVELIQEGK